MPIGGGRSLRTEISQPEVHHAAMRKRILAIGSGRLLATFAVALAACAAPRYVAAQGTIVRASVNNAAAPANGQQASMSADGRLVAFVSNSDLDPQDTNGASDVYVRDIVAGTTTLVSLRTDSLAGNAGCSDPQISANGRFIAYASAATNLDGQPTGGFKQIFVRDLQLGTTARISVVTAATANGDSGLPAISADGHYVAFESFASNLTADTTGGVKQIFLRDTTAATTILISRATTPAGAVGNGDSLAPAISSDDGRFIAFTSFAANLNPVADPDTNNRSDIYIRDRVLNTTTRVSVGPVGIQSDNHSFGVTLSSTGRHVAFFSQATNLLVLSGGQSPPAFRQAYVRDRGTPDGNGGYNDAAATNPNRAVSVNAAGQFGNDGSGLPSSSERAAISANGRFVAFRSSATNIGGPATIARADIYLHDRDPDENSQFDEPGLMITFRASATLPSTVTQPADCGRPSVAATGTQVFVTYETLSNDVSPGNFNATGVNVFRAEPTLCTEPRATSQPAANTSVCLGQQLSLTVVADGAEPLAYQWRRNSTAIPGAIAATYVKPSATAGDSGTYTCVVSNACGTITTDSAVVTVSSFGILVQPQPLNKCTGNTATFSVAASGATAYQWRKDTVNLVNGPTGNGSTIANATASNLTITSLAIQDAGSYDCVVTSTGCGTLTSNAVALTVGQAPAVTSQPADTTACIGRPFSLTITATGGLPLTYQWKKNGANIANTNNPTYTKASAVAGDAGNYTCQVSNSCGAPATSNVAVVSVLGNPSISQQPATQTICSGATASFSITAAVQAGLTYRWRRGAVDLNNGGNISGADTPTLFISPATTADAATNYSCVVTGTCGAINSSSVALNINTPPSISQQPANTTVVSGDVATFRVTAGGSNPLTYQWRRGGSPISGATAATLNINPATAANAGPYDVVVTNLCGSLISQAATLTVTGGGSNPDPGNPNPDPGTPTVPNPSGSSCGTCGAAAPQGLAMALMAMAWSRFRRARRR